MPAEFDRDEVETWAEKIRSPEQHPREFPAAVEDLGQLLLQLARALPAPESDVEDLACDVLNKIVFERAIDKYKPRANGSFIAWCHVTAKNHWLNWSKIRQREQSAKHSQIESALVAHALQNEDGESEEAEVWSALTALDARAREIVRLRVFVELSFAEIADELGMTNDAAARQAFARARRALASLLPDVAATE